MKKKERQDAFALMHFKIRALVRPTIATVTKVHCKLNNFFAGYA